MEWGHNPHFNPRAEEDSFAPKPAESDPTGRDAHAPGAKLDAGKPLPALVIGNFAAGLTEVVQVGTDGARKYTPNGWKEVPDGPARYMEALWRHLMAHMAGEVLDPQSGHRHMAHVAWNALAYLTLTFKRKRKD